MESNIALTPSLSEPKATETEGEVNRERSPLSGDLSAPPLRRAAPQSHARQIATTNRMAFRYAVEANPAAR